MLGTRRSRPCILSAVSFILFVVKRKIRRMRKASVVYALVTFVSALVEILISLTSLTEYSFRVFSSSTSCVSEYCIQLFYGSLSFFWCSLYLRVE